MDTGLIQLREDFGVELAGGTGPLQLDDYQEVSGQTDKSDISESESGYLVLLGLFGEVGSLVSELKKKQRDQSAYFAYRDSALEQLGDVLWYFSNFARKRSLRLSALVSRATVSPHEPELVSRMVRTFKDLQPQGILFPGPITGPKVQQRLLRLAAKAGELVGFESHGEMDRAALEGNLVEIFRALIDTANDAEVSLEEAAIRNLHKVFGKWPVKRVWGQLYDDSYDENEQFPRLIEIDFSERRVRGTDFVFQKCRGINIGDRLTDNRDEQDDYRFHDVFHMSYAAVLGWSPVLRALFKIKRKSNSAVDESQDGARAIITEEGISNWIFAQGRRHENFETVGSLDFQLLKTIRDMVRGYEVETRPMWMWEHAILEGFRVFRELKAHRSGTVVADLRSRSLEFKSRRTT